MTHNKVILAIAIAFVVLAILFGETTTAPGRTIDAILGDRAITLEVADTATLRARGLGGRSDIASDNGMLFVYDALGKHSFWMKDMLFDLDILWFDEEYELVHSVRNVSTNTYPHIFEPSVDARYVVELNAGVADAMGIKNGDVLTIVDTVRE